MAGLRDAIIKALGGNVVDRAATAAVKAEADEVAKAATIQATKQAPTTWWKKPLKWLGWGAVGTGIVVGAANIGESDNDKERRQAIEVTAAARKANRDVIANETGTDVRELGAVQNGGDALKKKMEDAVAADAAANPKRTAAEAALAAKKKREEMNLAALADPVKTKAAKDETRSVAAGREEIYHNNTCQADGVFDPASSNTKYQALHVLCKQDLLKAGDKTTVILQTIQRDAAGRPIFGPRDAKGVSKPIVTETQIIEGVVGPDSKSVTIPKGALATTIAGDPAVDPKLPKIQAPVKFVGRDNVIVEYVAVNQPATSDPDAPLVGAPSIITVSKNPGNLKKFTP